MEHPDWLNPSCQTCTADISEKYSVGESNVTTFHWDCNKVKTYNSKTGEKDLHMKCTPGCGSSYRITNALSPKLNFACDLKKVRFEWVSISRKKNWKMGISGQ